MNVTAIIFGFIFLLAGGALALFAGIRMSQPGDPDITITAESGGTSRSAQAGKSGLVLFIIIGIVLAVAGIAMLVRGFGA